ncbi:hypothetical protein niasHT_038593 [Heterodera trifolii]|uniref:Uncharacterized protein n=1 Tax=Heterodera trifolii TaxID=157864 RepID=A0ABD2I8F3_9BILA
MFKDTPQPNPNAETPQQDEAGPSTSAAPTEEAMEPPPPTPGPVPTPDMNEEILEFDDLPPSTSATPIGDLVPFPSTPIAPMDIGEMTPPPLVIDDRSERIEQLEMELKDRNDTIKFLREQVRNREALISDLRRQLKQCAASPMAPPTTSKMTPNRGRPKKMLDELQRSARRDIVDQIVGVIDRDRSRSASRASLDRIHRDIRHKFAHYTPKKGQEQKKGMDDEDGLLLLVQLGTQKAYQRMKATLREFGLIRKCNLVFWLVTLKRRICAPLCYEQMETNGGVGFVCVDVRSALESRFVAVFPAKDSRENLELYGQALWGQICQIEVLSGKTVKWFIVFHFVPFARQHQFIGLLDEQGDEALYSVWRRLEQWWKCMPDAEQILQQLEHHFVNNWLLDIGRIDELKRNYEERKGEDDTDEEAVGEIDDDCQIDVI